MANPIRGFHFQEVLNAVGRVEKTLGIPSPPRPVVYRRISDWFVRSDYLKYCWRSLGQEDSGVVIPWFAMKPRLNALLKVVKRYHFFSTYPGQTAATVIWVKNNVRAFYLDDPSRPLTIKLLLSKTRQLEDMRREVEVRLRIGQHRALNVPQLLEHDLESDPPFLSEELIFGRPLHRRRDVTAVITKLCPQLWRTYQEQGMVLKRLREMPSSQGATEVLRQICDAHIWEKGWIEKDVFISKASQMLKSDFAIPVSVCHGDLRFQNMIVRLDGTIFVLDWECAHEMPVISDILNLSIKVPQAWSYFSDQIDVLSAQHPSAKVLGFRGQLFFAVVNHLVAYGRRKSLTKPRKFADELACASQLLGEASPGF